MTALRRAVERASEPTTALREMVAEIADDESTVPALTVTLVAVWRWGGCSGPLRERLAAIPAASTYTLADLMNTAIVCGMDPSQMFSATR